MYTIFKQALFRVEFGKIKKNSKKVWSSLTKTRLQECKTRL